MKFKKPSQKASIDHATLIGGSVVGAMISDGIVGFADDNLNKAKKPDTTLAIRGGVAVAAGVAGACLTGSDTATTAVKGALLGVAVHQGVQVVKSMLNKSEAVKAATAGATKSAKFLRDVTGLGCAACSSHQGMGATRRRRKSRGMGMVLEQGFAPIMDMVPNPMQEAFNLGLNAA